MGVLANIDRDKRIRASVRAMESRASLDNPNIPLNSSQAWQILFGSWASSSGIDVTPDDAMGVPPFGNAVDFIAGTMASLPLITYRSSQGGRSPAENDNIYYILHDVVNVELMTSFIWRKHVMTQCLWRGRSFTFIERTVDGKQVTNLWPLITDCMKVERVNARKQYRYREPGGKEYIYRPDEILDIPFHLANDGCQTVDTVARFKDSLGLAISLERYAAKFFQNGGVPPLAMQMPAGTTGGAAKRGIANIEELIQVAHEEKRLVLPMPEGHRLEPIGFKPEDGQLIVARKLQNVIIGSIFHLPPVFLQDLEFGTFTNSEQQDLHYVKHTLMQHIKCFEQELNAKLFYRPRSKLSCEINVDGLLRGDFTTRMDGYGKAIQNAVMTPDEARELENRPKQGGDAAKLHIQGATVPLGSQPVRGAPTQTPTPAPAANEGRS